MEQSSVLLYSVPYNNSFWERALLLVTLIGSHLSTVWPPNLGFSLKFKTHVKFNNAQKEDTVP